MLEPDDADAWYSAAQRHARVGEQAQAVVAYSSVLAHDPDHVKARVGRGMALQQTGEHDAAIRDFSDVIERTPQWAGLYVVFYCRACSQKALGRLDATIEDASRAIERNPNHIDALYLRGTALKEIGQTENAIEDLNIVLQADPNYHDAYYARGTIFHLRGQWREAVDDFTAFLKHAPASNGFVIDCHRLRAIAAYELGQHESALVDLSSAIESDPSDAPSYFRRSQVFQAMGDAERAKADIIKATSLDQER